MHWHYLCITGFRLVVGLDEDMFHRVLSSLAMIQLEPTCTISCECPTWDDSTSSSCLDRRIVLVSSQVSTVTELDSTGLSPATGEIAMRNAYTFLNQRSVSVDERTSAIRKLITDSTDGVQSITGSTVKRVLNQETLSAQSVNNAYGNLINVTDLTQNAMSKSIVDQVIASIENVTSYMEEIQSQSEGSTYQNLLVGNSYNLAEVKALASTLSESLRGVYNALTSFDVSMGSAEDDSGNLEDSLAAASDRLSGKITDFAASFPSYTFSSDNVISRDVASLQRQFEHDGIATVTNYGNTAMSKRVLFVNSTNVQIDDQTSSERSMSAAVSDEMSAQITSVATQQSKFATTDQFSSMEDYIYDLVANGTSDVHNRTQTIRANLSVADQARFSVANIFSGFDDRQKLVGAKNFAQAQLTDAQSVVTDTVNSFGLHKKDFTVGAQNLANAAVDAVGTSSLVSSMLTEYDRLNQETDKSANSVALDSKYAAGSLATASGGASAAIANGSEGVTDAISGVASASLGAVMSLPVVSSTPVVSMDSNADEIFEQVDTAAAGSASVPATVAQTAANEAVGSTLSSISEWESTSQAALDSVYLSTQGAPGAPIATPASVSVSLADSANEIASTEDAFGTVLSNLMQSGSDSINAAAETGRDMSAVTEAAAAVETAQAQLDAVPAQGAGADALAQSVTTIHVIGAQTDSAGANQSNELNKGVAGSQSELDDAVSGAAASGSALASGTAAAVAAVQAQAQADVDNFDVALLDSARAAAATTLALLTQMDSVLTDASPKLDSLAAALPARVTAQFLSTKRLLDKLKNLESVSMSPMGVVDSGSLNRLTSVGANFNTTADAQSVVVQASIKSLMDEFVSASNGVHSQLASLGAAAMKTEGVSIDPIASLNDIRASLSTAFSNLNEKLAKVVMTPVALNPLFGSAIDTETAAANDAASIQDYISSVSTSAAAASTALGSMGVSDAEAKVSQQASSVSLSEAIAAAKLSADQTAHDTLTADSASVIDGFKQEATLQILSSNNRADTVYESVLKSKADIVSALGSIAAKFADMQSSLSASSGGSSVNYAALQTHLANMFGSFNSHNEADKQLYDSTKGSDMLNTNMMEIKQAMAAVDTAIAGDLKSIQNQIQATKDGNNQITTEGSIETSVGSLKSKLDDWAKTTMESLMIATAPPNQELDIETPIKQKVHDIANMAIKAITDSGKTVPSRLSDLATD